MGEVISLVEERSRRKKELREGKIFKAYIQNFIIQSQNPNLDPLFDYENFSQNIPQSKSKRKPKLYIVD